MPGLVKVGFTMNDPDKRARDLANTGNPHPYIVDYQVWVDDPYSVEQQAHSKLTGSGYRVGEKRFSGSGVEWFSCKIEQAIVAIRHATGGEYAHETFRRAEREVVEANFRKEVARQRAEEHVARLKARLETEFKTIVAVAFPPRPYWQYFLSCYIGSVIILAFCFSKMTGNQVFFASFLFGGLAALFFQAMREDSHLKSSAYAAMKANHEKEIENAKWHFFGCPHCSASMKINYVEAVAEGSQIKFHCKSCDKDLANPLADSRQIATTETVGQGGETKALQSAQEMPQKPRDQLRGATLAAALTPVDQAVLDMIESSLKRSEQMSYRHESKVDHGRANGAALSPMSSANEWPSARYSPLRSALLNVWDSDVGNNTMRQDLWHSFQAGLGVELSTSVAASEAKKERISRASNHIWENRSAPYEKALWIELDDAIAAALPKERWRGQ